MQKHFSIIHLPVCFELSVSGSMNAKALENVF